MKRNLLLAACVFLGDFAVADSMLPLLIKISKDFATLWTTMAFAA
jgi:hypothetical protein